MAAIKYNADLLASAIIEQGYKDYRKCAVKVHSKLEERGVCPMEDMDKLRRVQKDLLGDRIQLCMNLMQMRLSPRELKTRYENEHPDLFQNIREAGLII